MVRSSLDSVVANIALLRALETEGLVVEHSDTARGRVICAPRPSDSYGGGLALVWYLALVHRRAQGGSEIWLGGLMRTRPGAATTPEVFARMRSNYNLQPRPEGDLFFLGPSGGSLEWRRLERIAEAVARAGA